MVDIADLLRSNPYFENLSPVALAAYMDETERVQLKKGEVLIRQAEAGEDIYLLLDGRLKATQSHEGGIETILGTIGRGELVGEMAVLLDQKRKATISAIRDSLLLKFSGERFLDLVGEQSSSLKVLAQTIVKRSERSYAMEESNSSVLLLSLSEGLDMEDIGQSLVNEIGRQQTVSAVSASRAEADLNIATGGLDGQHFARFNAYAAKLDVAGEMLVFWGGNAWSDWLDCVARRVDRVLLFACHGEPVELRPIERELRRVLNQSNHVPIELVLFHEEGTDPRGVSNWLAGRELVRHHNLLQNDAGGFKRLARFLTGNAIGLALSGGGFRSAFQMGVLQVLLQEGVPIDLIGGSSGGATVGAFIAGVGDLESMTSQTFDAMQVLSRSPKYTFPMVALFEGKRYTRSFQDLFGDREIEDLWINYFCLSLGLVSGDLIAHQTGPAWRAVRSSSSVMGMVPPVIHEGECLVDGGFINPCPSDYLTKMGMGKIIVVDASSKSGVELDYPYPPETSGWGLLWKRMNPFFKRKISPSIGTSIVQSMFRASDHLLDQVRNDSRIDLLISTDLEGFSASDNSRMKELYAFGKEFARGNLSKWKAVLGLAED